MAASGDVRIVAISNPIIAGGPFYEAFTSDRERWKTITISAFETPNFENFTLEQLRELPRGLSENDPIFTDQPRPYLLGRRWVYDAFWKYGELSPFWQSRVLGNFPEQADDALISLRWLEGARSRALSSNALTLHAGVDVAGPGDDETVAIVRDSTGAIVELQAWGQPDPRGEVACFLAPYKGPLESVNVDSAGIGYYFGCHLADLGHPVNFVNVGEATSFPDKFANLKAQLYWALRERFEAGDVAGLTDELTVSQLAAIRYRHNPRGQVVIESKEEARKRGVKSPDRVEAVMLAFSCRDPLAGLREFYRMQKEEALKRQQRLCMRCMKEILDNLPYSRDGLGAYHAVRCPT